MIWIRISDPRSAWIVVHQRNWQIHSAHGFIGSFDAPRHSATLRPNIFYPKIHVLYPEIHVFYPEIHEVNLWQVYDAPWSRQILDHWSQSWSSHPKETHPKLNKCNNFKDETSQVWCTILHFTAPLFTEQSKTLIQTLRLSHCTLDIERSHILPVLLQKGDQEIDSKIDIRHKFILAHFNMANGHSKTENLKFNNESTNLLYQISWPQEMVVSACTRGLFL